MLKIENLCYKYDFCQSSALTIKNVNFEVEKNKILAIVGASGSGKSTLAKLLAGLLTPLSGQILLDGKNISETKNIYSKIGISLQNPEKQLFCRTIYDELAFSLKNFGYNSDKIMKSITETKNLFDIKPEILSAFPPNLSLGDQRKCAIACATVLNPKILILDEPTAGLDYKNKNNLINFVKIYKEKSHCSVIIISHDIELVSEIADEIIILQNGEKVIQDTPKNVFSNYENLDTFGLQKPKINRIIQLVNSNKKYLKKDIYTIDEVLNQISLKINHKWRHD